LLTKVVVHVGKNVPVPLIEPADVMSKIRMRILVPVEDLGNHVVGLELFNINVKDVLSLVRVKSNNLVLKLRDLVESLRYEVGCSVRGSHSLLPGERTV
jgi:hypothetical protein